LLPRHAKISGSVRLDGREILGAPSSELDQVRGGRVAMIFQDPASALNPVLTIRKQLCEALALHRDLSGVAVKA
jgi:peptide/nickel transport system ATP-binding protein